MADKNSFVLYSNYNDILKDLPDEDAGKLFKAILEYQATGNIKELPVNIDLAFKFIKNQLDIDAKKYNDFCEKQKNNGLKGGAPKGNKNAKKNNPTVDLNNPKQPKTTQNNLNDNDNDNDNDNVNDNDNDLFVIEKTKTKKFVIPSLNEIKNYCIERKNKIDAEKFFDFYQSKGWLIGKTKMKDWKAAIRTWEKKETITNPPEVKKEYNCGF